MLLVLCLLASFAMQSWLLAKLASKSDQAPNTDVGQIMQASFARPLSSINSYIIGRRALFSCRARYDVIELSNCRTEERSEAEFFCVV